MTSPLAMLALATPSAPPSGAPATATPGATKPAASVPDSRGARDGKDASRFSDIMARQRAGQDAAAPADGAPRAPADAATANPQATTPAGEDTLADDGQPDDDKLAAAVGADAAPTLAQQALAIATLSLQLQSGAPATGAQGTSGGQDALPAGAATGALVAGLNDPAALGAAAAAQTPAVGATPPADGNTATDTAALVAAQPSAPALPAGGAQGALAGADTGSAAAAGAHPGTTAQADARAIAGGHAAAGATVDAAANRQAPAEATADARPDAGARPQDDALRAAANTARGGADKDLQADGAPRATPHAAPTDIAQALASTWQAPAPSAPQNAAAPAIHTPVGQPQWGAELGSQLVLMTHRAGNDSQTAQLRLDPPDLGPLSVTIKLNNGVAEASFVSAHAAVRQAVESALPQLQQSLAQAGISLGQANVSDQGAQAGFGGMNQGGDRPGHGAGASAQAQADGSGDTVQITVPAARRAEAGRVDTFA